MRRRTEPFSLRLPLCAVAALSLHAFVASTVPAPATRRVADPARSVEIVAEPAVEPAAPPEPREPEPPEPVPPPAKAPPAKAPPGPNALAGPATGPAGEGTPDGEERANDDTPPAASTAAVEPPAPTGDVIATTGGAGDGAGVSAGGSGAGTGGAKGAAIAPSTKPALGTPGGKGHGPGGPARLGDDHDWSSCPFPRQAKRDRAFVRISVVVGPNGDALDVHVLADPGEGFGLAASTCARHRRYVASKNEDGVLATKETDPFLVFFTR